MTRLVLLPLRTAVLERSSRWRLALADRVGQLRQATEELPKLRLPKPTPLGIGAVFVLLAGVYSFGIGRARFKASSDFLVRQPMAPSMVAPSVIGTSLGSPTMLGSLEDGRYLAVYLHSPEVMERTFQQLLEEERYRRQGWDLLAGLPANATGDQ